ncbi:hypothetical protein EB001_25375, partial [bacterium]|nr:hypothetical protein [bacterium]
LQEVRLYGTWETWLEFFLEGIFVASKQALNTITEINTLFEVDYAKIESLGRARFSCIQIMDYLKKLPQVSVALMSKELQLSAPAARRSLHHLVALGIIKEITGKQRDKVYVYSKYLAILEKDCVITPSSHAKVKKDESTCSS